MEGSPDRKILPNDVLLGEVSELLAEGSDVVIMTKGNSMLPFIHGDRDSVKLFKKDVVTVGDIVLAEIAPGHYVLHRVIKVDSDILTLQGDGNLRGVEHCCMSNVKGTVVEIIKPGKTVVPDRGRLWFCLRPVRRILLGIYRRILL